MNTHLGTFVGANMRANYRAPEPAVSLLQAVVSGLVMATFVVAAFAAMVGAHG